MTSSDAHRAEALSRYRWTVPLLVMAALAVAHTWPLALHPAALSRNDNADAQLNEWILAWVEHTLPRAPLHLFQGEHLLSRPRLAGVFGAAHRARCPRRAGRVARRFARARFQRADARGLALSGLAAYALDVTWTGDWRAALLTGSTFAFNTHTLTRLPHTQALHIYGLPLALVAVDRSSPAQRTRDALLLALWLTVMAYTSGYLLVFGGRSWWPSPRARATEWLPQCPRRSQPPRACGRRGGDCVAPLALPYQRAAAEQGMVRSLEAVAEYSATPKGYLAAAGWIHIATWSARFFKDPVNSFFPGFVVFALALVAICRLAPVRWALAPPGHDARSRSRSWVSCFRSAPHTPVYSVAVSRFPADAGAARRGAFRQPVPARDVGPRRIRHGRRHSRTRSKSARARYARSRRRSLALAANVESLRGPIRIPAVHRNSAPVQPARRRASRGPGGGRRFIRAQAVFENAEFVLNSTAHWRPLMNGYSGYTPAPTSTFADAFWYFPRDYAIDAMRRAGVTHVMVHPERFGNEADDVIGR